MLPMVSVLSRLVSGMLRKERDQEEGDKGVKEGSAWIMVHPECDLCLGYLLRMASRIPVFRKAQKK